jgi:hypothetical protein
MITTITSSISAASPPDNHTSSIVTTHSLASWQYFFVCRAQVKG